MKKTIILLIAFLMASGSLIAQPMWGARWGQTAGFRSPALFMQAQLNLTDDQVSKINDIILTQRENAINTRTEIQKLRLEIRKLYLSDNFDAAKIKELNSKILELQNQQWNRRVETQSKISEILTPEQRKLWMTYFGGRWGGRGFGMGPRGFRRGFGPRGGFGFGPCNGYGMMMR